MWYIYTMEYYSAIKKGWNNAICSNMDGPGDYHTKWSQTEKDKCIILLICGILEKNTNKLIYKTEQTHRLREQRYDYQGEKSWGEG